MSKTVRARKYRFPWNGRYFKGEGEGSTYTGRSGRGLKRASHRAERRMAKAELRGDPPRKLRGQTHLSECNWRGW